MVVARRRVGVLGFLAILAAALLALVPLPRAHAATGAVHPSMMLYTEGGQCTANFVYTDGAGTTYIGQAAHCSSQGGQTDTDGCTTPSYPLGTPVTDANGQRIGTLAYNSWLAMQAAHETDPNACAANDLALVKVDPSLAGQVDPTVPNVGGPNGLNTTGVTTGDQVYAVGNSSLLLGLGSAAAQTGVVEGVASGGWAFYVLMVRPGVPGDSGSPYLDAQGRALGQLSTISVGTEGVGNTVGNLSREITYAQSHGVPGLHVVNGAAFKGLTGLVGGLG